MDIGETLTTSLEKLRKLGDGNNEQLPNIEKYVTDEISALLDAEVPLREYFMKVNKYLLFNISGLDWEFSGSVVEGAMMARTFQVNKDLEVEIDFMINYFTIPQELSHLLEPVKDKPGFVRLPFCLLPTDHIDVYVDNAKRFLGRRENEQNSLNQMRQYISPLVMKDRVNNMCDDIPVSDMFNYLCDIVGCKMSNLKMNYSQTETTVAMECVSSRRLPVMSLDYVPAVHLSFWPCQASDWITRYRVWPPHDIIQGIVDNGCQVVPHTSPGGDVHSGWRLSFSRPEATLAKLRSKEQERSYYFFKMFFYRYLKCVESSETEGKMLYSYVTKTIMGM